MGGVSKEVIIDYLLESLFGAAVPGSWVVLAGGVGAAAGATCLAAFPETPLRRSSSEDEEPDFGMKAGDIMQRIPTIAANIQVPFSRISVVCFTPINWLPKPPKVPESPPPLGFCISTINPKMIEASMIRTPNKASILSFF